MREGHLGTLTGTLEGLVHRGSLMSEGSRKPLTNPFDFAKGLSPKESWKRSLAMPSPTSSSPPVAGQTSR